MYTILISFLYLYEIIFTLSCLILLQKWHSPWCSLNMTTIPLPQGLCTCYFFCLKWFCFGYQYLALLFPSGICTKATFSVKHFNSPSPPLLKSCHPQHLSSFPALFLHSTYRHQTYMCFIQILSSFTGMKALFLHLSSWDFFPLLFTAVPPVSRRMLGT